MTGGWGGGLEQTWELRSDPGRNLGIKLWWGRSVGRETIDGRGSRGNVARVTPKIWGPLRGLRSKENPIICIVKVKIFPALSAPDVGRHLQMGNPYKTGCWGGRTNPPGVLSIAPLIGRRHSIPLGGAINLHNTLSVLGVHLQLGGDMGTRWSEHWGGPSH